MHRLFTLDIYITCIFSDDSVETYVHLLNPVTIVRNMTDYQLF